MKCAYEIPQSFAASETSSAAQEPPSDHCHQYEGESDPQNSPAHPPFGENHPSNCQIHAAATAAEISVKAKSLHLIKIPAIEVYHGTNASFDQLSGIIKQVFRPPPASGIHSILRI